MRHWPALYVAGTLVAWGAGAPAPMLAGVLMFGRIAPVVWRVKPWKSS